MAQEKIASWKGIAAIAGIVLGMFFLIAADSLFGGADWAYVASGIGFAVFIGFIIWSAVRYKSR